MEQDALPWSKKFALGFTTIDAHHKELVTMINDLNRAMKNGQSSNVVIEIIGRLNKYVVKHFQYEERHFDEFAFVESVSHKKHHHEFKEKVVELSGKYAEMRKLGECVDKELITFLVNWLMSHILEEDKKYVECFKQHNLT